MKKNWIFFNKPVYLGLAILELSRILIYEFWYDYVKPEFGELECSSIDRPLLKIKNKKVIGLMNDELGESWQNLLD